jgi:hypothetical protein
VVAESSSGVVDSGSLTGTVSVVGRISLVVVSDSWASCVSVVESLEVVVSDGIDSVSVVAGSSSVVVLVTSGIAGTSVVEGFRTCSRFSCIATHCSCRFFDRVVSPSGTVAL